ncbi:MAG: hypothetical protein DRR11_02375 [Gammaproteobacteria bacterium]|nr:MAG: hypothetical protein DRR11_02375 [Gammaproteobacteria bacterium]RLA37762.1 MAG: hypothetical protein DRR15_01090 [Gammaproteobacteria bacterium]
MDDPAWRGAEPITGFKQTQPNAGQPASQRTEVFVGFTATALHIAVIAYDDNPLEIITTDTRRDSSLNETDSFRVIIDGLLDRQNGYVFGTNSAGMEFDGQVSREGAGQFIPGGADGLNLNWDAPWTVKASISDIGWSAEMEIPFTSLRYGSGDVQVWGFNFERRIRRNNEIAFWAPLSQERNLYRVSEAGSIEGIGTPPQRNLQITPYVLAKTREGGDLPNSESNEEVGLDLKYSITPSLTLDATLNTDFAQVEVDDQQVNLDRFSLFFPEKRPFFLENAGQFTVGNPREVELFFSRRIGIEDGTQVPIIGGARLSGKIGATTNVGFLYMASDDVTGISSQNDFIVARVNQELANRSSIGFLIVDRHGDGSLLDNGSDDQNQTYAVDGRWGIGDNLLLQGWAAKTETPGLIGKDDAFSIKGDYNNADWSAGLGYTELGGDFNPEVGFLSRDGYRKVDGRILRRIRPDNLWNLFEIRPHISYRGFWDFDGFQETGFIHIDSHWEFNTSREIHTGVNIKTDGVKEEFEIIPGVTIPVGTYDESELQLIFIGNQSKPLNFGLRTTFGGIFGGDRISLSPTVRYRIGEKFTSELAYNYNDVDIPVQGGDFTANLARLRLSYSFTPKILLQLLTQYNEVDDQISTNLRFSWLQSANTGLYLVYNEIDERGLGAPPRGREFIIKFSHIFDVLR